MVHPYVPMKGIQCPRGKKPKYVLSGKETRSLDAYKYQSFIVNMHPDQYLKATYDRIIRNILKKEAANKRKGYKPKYPYFKPHNIYDFLPSKGSVKNLTKRMCGHKEIDIPYLETENCVDLVENYPKPKYDWNLNSCKLADAQEGRHRALVASKLGIKTIPVLIYVDGLRNAKGHTRLSMNAKKRILEVLKIKGTVRPGEA